MNKDTIVETFVGALVLLIAAYFLHYAYSTTQVIKGHDQYIVYGKFDRVDGLNLGADVRISGIKVGKIISQTLDLKSFQAILELSISSDIKLPADSSAEIISGGLLSDKYVSITPGSDDEHLTEKSFIEYTQSSISLEGLISKFMFGLDKDKDKDKDKDSNAKPEIGTTNVRTTN